MTPTERRRAQPEPDSGPDIDALSKLPIRPDRHPGRWVSGIATAILLALILYGVASNENFGWDIAAQYVFHPRILAGLWLTIVLTIAAMAIGIVLGIALAVAQMAGDPILSKWAAAFIWFFRGTPVLVQLIFWYNLAALFPELSIGVPFFGPTLVAIDANHLITPLVAALLGLGLNEGAYMAEIMRAGILAIDAGQTEAGKSVGMRFSQIMRVVILPQAMRVIIPPTGNETIGMLKTTSLVSVIALADLLYSAQSIYSVNFRTIPLLLAICAWYLLLTSVLTYLQGILERRVRQSERTQMPAHTPH